MLVYVYGHYTTCFLTQCSKHKGYLKARGQAWVTHVHRRWGLSGLCWGAGRRKVRIAHIAVQWCCADSFHTHPRSHCHLSCTQPCQNDMRWSAHYTHTLKKKKERRKYKERQVSFKICVLQTTTHSLSACTSIKHKTRDQAYSVREADT